MQQKLIQIINQNITHQTSMKRRIFWSVFFYRLFRLQIYEAIAAIFWQSDRYVFKLE